MIIDNINNNTNQEIEFILSDKSIIYITLHYKDNLQQWFIDIKYNEKNFELYNLLLTCNKNVLSQYSNILPFGIKVISKENLQPYFKDCFINGNCQLVVNEYE